ncbi:eukaryotic translation initiation factor 1 [Hordeum vulgare]|nr:eukaryotic translation initiation factor 1 [Hordeum vulgare]
MSDLDVQVPTAFDPFAEANAEDSGAGAGSKNYVHVRVQQRNGRKSLTTVQGLKKDYSYNKILKDLKKEFCCNGTVVQDPELGQVIQLQGDQRKNVATFLVQLFETLQGSLRPPAPYVDVSYASEIEDEGVMESRSDSSAGSEDPLESEGTERLVTFEEDFDEVEEVTSPPLTCGRRQRGGATAADEAAGKKGKGATASRPASKRPAPGPLAGQRAGDVKRHRGAGRRQVPVVAGEAEDSDEDTASAAERAGWEAGDAAQRELEMESKRRWDTAAGKAAVGQPHSSRVERPVEKRAKARHDHSAHARAEEPASEAASTPAPRAEGAQPSEPEASTQVDLETIPDSPRAEAAPDVPELDLAASYTALDAPGATMDAPDAAHPPPAEEVTPAGMAPEPGVEPAPGVSAIVVPQHGPVAPGAEGRAGSRPMRTWRAANLARLRLPAGTVLSGVPELVTMFSSSRSKALYDAQVQAYNELWTQHLGVDSQTAELEARLGEAATECDALRNAGDRLQGQLDLLQAEKKELEAAGRVELEQLRATLQEKEASYSADVDRLASLHLKEMDLKDAALREKEEALVQKQTQLAKALESAATLQEEVACLTHASKVREREVLEVSHETDGAFHRGSLFIVLCLVFLAISSFCCALTSWLSSLQVSSPRPRSRPIPPSRCVVRSAARPGLECGGDRGGASGPPARPGRVCGSTPGRRLVDGGGLVAEGVEPAFMSRLARWLAVGGERLDAWHASAARAGAYMALRLAKSWYRNLNLGKLAAQRDGSEAELQGLEEELRVRASTVAEYAAWDDFVLERGEDGGVIAEDLHGL